MLIVKPGDPSRCPAYCDCSFPTPVTVNSYQGHIPDLVKCHCGEEVPEASELEWKWQNAETEEDARISGTDIVFHSVYSQGTAIVRGEKPLKVGYMHFWEMRIITTLAGTDVMFGIGTDKMNLQQFKFHFVSALGTNAQSWGFSYNGRIQHNGVQLPYGQKFSQGCIVGIMLDRARGQLEFFLNRRSLGVAYANIPLDPNVQIYPMVCSTAARSSIRLINSTSEPVCLQLRAFQALVKQPAKLEELRQLPGLRPLLNAYWFLAPPVRYSCRSAENEYDIADEAVLSMTTRRRHKTKLKDDESDVNDIYANAHEIIAMQQQNDSDDEANATIGDCFDEYFHYLL